MGNCLRKSNNEYYEHHPIDYPNNNLCTVAIPGRDGFDGSTVGPVRIPRRKTGYYQYDFYSECNEVEPLIPKQDIKYANSLTVVLDLDETLVNARLCSIEENKTYSGASIGILIRPYVLELFYTLKSWNAEIIIWSSGLKHYVLTTLDYILVGNTDLVDHIIWRDNRWHPNTYEYPIPKDLTMLGRDMSKLIFIDNHPVNTIINPDNSIMVPDFNNDLLCKYLNPKADFRMNNDIKEVDIDFGILNENLTTDATILCLISTIHRIHKEVLEHKKSLDVRTILRDESLKNPFIRKWDEKKEVENMVGMYIEKLKSTWCYRIDSIQIDNLIDKLENDSDLTDFVRFGRNDYRQICELLELLPLTGDALVTMAENHEPLSPVRSNMIINPRILVDRYHKKYPETIYYTFGIDFESEQFDEYFEKLSLRTFATRLYGTF